MKVFSVFILLLLLFTAEAQAAETPFNAIKVHTEKGEALYSFSPFGQSYGELSVVPVDLGSDGIDELVIGSPAGIEGEVLLTGLDGHIINSFRPYEDSKQGVQVAVCDLDRDGIKEIITGPTAGQVSLVKIFDSFGEYKNDFYPYGSGFAGGVRVACGDINNDGKNELLTGPGIGGGPHLKIFNSDLELIHQSFPLSQPDVGGLDVKVEGSDIYLRRLLDDNDQIITASYQPSENQVTIREAIDANDIFHISSFQFANGEVGKLVSRKASNNSSEVVVFDQGNNETSAFKPFESGFSKTLAAHSADGPVQVSVQMSDISRNTYGQHILVDLSEQRLWAYENGGLVMDFLISSGRRGSETPLGITTVTDKLPVHDYRWFGGGRLTYFIPDVKWNLRFRRHYYIHSATWHNNFGQPMSAGCVNVHPDDAEKIYEWAKVGAVVEIVK